jgi:hypothetical protein
LADNQGGRKWIAYASVLVVPTLYAIGRSYSDAWVTAVGLPESAFPLSIEDTLYWGYVALLNAVAPAFKFLPSWLGVVAMFLVLWVLAASLIYAAKRTQGLARSAMRILENGLRRHLGKWKNEIDVVGRSYTAASVPFLAMGVMLYVLVLLMLPIYFGDKLGKCSGETYLREAKVRFDKTSFGTGDRVLVGSTGERSLLLMCGANGCGGLTRDGVVFVPWSLVSRIAPAKKGEALR